MSNFTAVQRLAEEAYPESEYSSEAERYALREAYISGYMKCFTRSRWEYVARVEISGEGQFVGRGKTPEEAAKKARAHYGRMFQYTKAFPEQRLKIKRRRVTEWQKMEAADDE